MQLEHTCISISNTNNMPPVITFDPYKKIQKLTPWSIVLKTILCSKHIYDTYVVQASSEIWISIPRPFDKVSAFLIPSEYLLHHTEVFCTFLKFNSNNYNS